jgi:hypothetical protein
MGRVTRRPWAGRGASSRFTASRAPAPKGVSWSDGRIRPQDFPLDTDTASDWASDREDPWTGRRMRFPGWAPERFGTSFRLSGTFR